MTRKLDTTRREQRVRFRDVKPYEIPASLDELRGPAHGIVSLPHSVYWAPGGGDIDLDAAGGIQTAYQAVLSEGRVVDQVTVLNRDRLIEIWPDLNLDHRIRDLWETRFPELCAVSTTQ